ncbi:MAG: phosphatase PAP2 family protein [Williamsia sp.]|nr:phosphatase PAP2 family protein [Williamsia sp.]
MVAYGVIGLRSHRLQAANEEVQEELWAENPHKLFHVDNYLQWAPAVAVYGLNLAGIKGKHNFKERTIIYGISTILMSSTIFEVKRVSKERRPDGSDLYSFPSGHTANAFATAEFMRQEYKDVSVWYGIGGYAAATLTGYLRMYNNKHWLSDVMAGAGIGIISTNAAYLIYPTIKKIFSQKDRISSTIILPAYQHGTLSIGAIHTF